MKTRTQQSQDRLTLRWGARLKQWAVARRASWNLEQCSPLELIARLDKLRSQELLWEVLEGEFDPLDRAICFATECHWVRHTPRSYMATEPYLDHSVQEVTRRATLEIPGIKPARIRHLLAREARKGYLRRTQRGRYVEPPWWWRNSDEDKQAEYNSEELQMARWNSRYVRQNVAFSNVMLVHYLIPLPTYRKAKALGISDRTYFYRLSAGLARLEMSFEIFSSRRKRFARSVQ